MSLSEESRFFFPRPPACPFFSGAFSRCKRDIHYSGFVFGSLAICIGQYQSALYTLACCGSCSTSHI